MNIQDVTGTRCLTLRYFHTILHPMVIALEVQVRIHSVANRNIPSVLINVHPKTDLQILAKRVETAMNYTGRSPIPWIMIMENGQNIRSRMPGDDMVEEPMTVATCMLQTPVRIICVDNSEVTAARASANYFS